MLNKSNQIKMQKDDVAKNERTIKIVYTKFKEIYDDLSQNANVNDETKEKLKFIDDVIKRHFRNLYNKDLA